MPKGEGTRYLDHLSQRGAMQIVRRFQSGRHGANVGDKSLVGTAMMRLDSETGCWLATGRANPEGYIQIKRGGINFMLHRLSLVAHTGLDVLGTASHLCHNPRCFNWHHLCDEDIRLNNARKGCLGRILRHRHREKLLYRACDHSPECTVRRYSHSCCDDGPQDIEPPGPTPTPLESSPPGARQ